MGEYYKRANKPYLVTETENSNVYASASLIIGIIAIPTGVVLLGFIIGIIAIVVGLVALQREKEQPELGGHNKAITGIFLGATGVFVSIMVIVFAAFALPYFSKFGGGGIADVTKSYSEIRNAHVQANLAVVQSQLKNIFVSQQSYFAENDRYVPPCRLTMNNTWFDQRAKRTAETLYIQFPSSAHIFDFYLRRDGGCCAIPNGINPMVEGKVDSVYCLPTGEIRIAYKY
ncbi:DUF4190 domain-containing protein [bacterium]|nr:DUF4190 domain-containing protein [bacterium]